MNNNNNNNVVGNRNFKTQAKTHSLTYPQCDVPLEEIGRQLKVIAGHRFGWHVISAEDHEERENDSSVGVHRHVHQEYQCRAFETINPRYWDITYNDKVYHPHFEKVKHRVSHIKYVIKDGIYIVEGSLKGLPVDIDSIIQASQSKQSYGYHWVATQMKEGKTIDELDDIAPGFIVNNKRKIEEYQVFLSQKKERRAVKPLFGGFDSVQDPNWQKVVSWTNTNFVSGQLGKMPVREPRQLQLWLTSRRHALGKSYPWKVLLREYFRCYDWVTNGHKQNSGIVDCDYILLDEFKGGMTIHDLKELSQMYGMNIPIRYGQDIYFKKNVPLIVTSQYEPHQIFSRPEDRDDVDSLASRFLVVYVDEVCYLHTIENPLPVPPPILENPLPVLEPLPEFDGDGSEDYYEYSSEDSDDSEYTRMQKILFNTKK